MEFIDIVGPGRAFHLFAKCRQDSQADLLIVLLIRLGNELDDPGEYLSAACHTP